MKWYIGSPMAQNSNPVPMPPHRDMVIQFQVLKAGTASGPPILMSPILEKARMTVRMMTTIVKRQINHPA